MSNVGANTEREKFFLRLAELSGKASRGHFSWCYQGRSCKVRPDKTNPHKWTIEFDPIMENATMPKDNDPVPYEIRQIQNRQIYEAVSKETTCQNCGEKIGYERLAGTVIEYGDMHFCDTVCHDEWLDAVQDKNEQKYADDNNG